jgi:putative addiction module component (TIGR02574 family)
VPRLTASGSIVLVTEATRDLLKRALKLSHKERDALVRELIISLDEDEDAHPAEIERAWSKEISRRLRGFDAGRTKAIPVEKVLADLRAAQARDRGRKKATRPKRA